MVDLRESYKKIISKTKINGKTSNIELKINSVIWSVIENLNKSDKVIIRGAGVHTEQLFNIIKQKYTLGEIPIIAIVDNGLNGDCLDGIPVITSEKAELLQYNTVIISSFSHIEEMKKDYNLVNIKVLDIYEELNKEGIKLTAPFYYYKQKNYEISLYYISQYKKNSSKENLEYVIDALLELKDFKSVFKCIDYYIELGYDNENIYINIKNELKKLLQEFTIMMDGRTGKDIIMFWIDAVPYSQVEWLQYVYSQKDESCFFENVYTVTPYTRPTMHTLLQGYSIIDDYDACAAEIDKTNSIVIQDIESAGYDYLYVGYNGTGNISEEYMINENCLNHEYAKMVSACSIYWEMLCYLSVATKPVFYMVHSAVETHEPYIALNLDDLRSYQISKILETGQNKMTYKYLDGQVEFYSGLLGNNNIKIYMSDHGNIIDWNKWKFAEQRIKTFFMVKGKNIRKQNIQKILSYKNFKYIVKWLLFSDEAYLNQALSGEAYIQEVDTYDVHAIANYIKKGKKKSGMAFRGVVTYKDKFFRIGNGEEFYFKLKGEMEEEEISNPGIVRLNELREKAGYKFIDINKYKQFYSSKKLYE